MRTHEREPTSAWDCARERGLGRRVREMLGGAPGATLLIFAALATSAGAAPPTGATAPGAAAPATLAATHTRALAPARLAAKAKPKSKPVSNHGPVATPISVSVDSSQPGRAIPGNFLGLSFELSALPQIAAYASSGDLVTMLRSLGSGGVLRFGGGSADTRVAWTDEATPRPAWASSVIDPAELGAIGVLAAESGWRVVLTIGLAHYEPEAAAREAAAAKAAIGESLVGIELGNEPNAFAQHGLRSQPWGFVQYNTEIVAYRSAIEAAAPGIPLDGPDVSGSAAFEEWGLGEVINQRPAELTGHHYPLGCEQTPAPSIGRLLSPLVRQKEAGSLARYMSIARAGKTPFRLDETNSVSCGGTAGISNTFASSLWAVGYLAQTMSMGVAGINLQGNPGNCLGYTPVCAPTPEALASGALSAQPEWYALLLAKELIGNRPLGERIGAPTSANVRIKTLLAPDGALHFVIVDDDPPGSRQVAVGLHVGSGYGGASVLSLRAPSLTSLSGVTLGGQAVAPDGSWTPSPLPLLGNRGGAITTYLKADSAALVTVSPRTPR